ncbi:MAG: ATP-binding protein [Symploca sp. SIO2C1]|nr:ATP-binding protein [Symploca sp. SIO2C1]
MTLDLRKFYQAINPAKSLAVENSEDGKYYIDFSSVRGNQTIENLKRTIRLSDTPTCQLFTGQIGCGKSTELLRLKAQLEQEEFHVVYFESSQDLDMLDVDVGDILLAIARHVSGSLKEITIGEPKGFKRLLQDVAKFLQTEIDLSSGIEFSIPGIGQITISSEETSLALGIGKITAKVKESPKFRDRLRQYLEPQTKSLIDTINQELLEPAINSLKQQGKKGLVVIVDNLDRVDNRPKPSGSTQQEYLFIDRGEQLRGLNCHVVYTVPLGLIFSNEFDHLSQQFMAKPLVLPMVSVKLRDGSECAEGMILLRQMVLTRAFPDLSPEQRIDRITEIFDSSETLNRLCRVSGGHVRNLLWLLHECLLKDDPPYTRDLLEEVIGKRRNEIILAVTEEEWALLRQVGQQKKLVGSDGEQILIQSMFIYEYRDSQGFWFDVNPILAEARELAEALVAVQKDQKLLENAVEKVQQFLMNTGAITTLEEKRILRITAIPGRLKSYAPLPVMFAAQPIDQNVTELVQYSAKLAGNSLYKVSILLYRKPPDTSVRLQMAQVRARDHFVLIPIPFAAIEQALSNEATSTGLLAQYAERYLPGADLFDDRNAIGDTLCFFGRGNLLHSLEEDLRRNQGIGLFGLRKSGKTSLLLQLGFAMRQYPVVHIDLQPYGGKLRYGAELFNKILQELSLLIKKSTPNATLNWATFQRDCPAADLGTDFVRQVSELAKLLSESGYQLPILLFLDEIERILPTKEDSRERAEEFNAFFGGLRALSQEKQLLSILIADVHPDLNRINHWSQASVPTNPVFNFFKEIFVFPFSEEETTEMLIEIGKLMGVAFDKETLVTIHRESGGHPFIARQLASLLCQKTDQDKSESGKLIKLSTVTRYLKRPFKYSGILKDYFEQSIWADLKKRENFSAMAILRLIACNEELPEGVKEEALLDRLSSDFSESECLDALRWLEDVGLLVREELEEDDSYQLQILLMSRWLKMQMKPEEINRWQLK